MAIKFKDILDKLKGTGLSSKVKQASTWFSDIIKKLRYGSKGTPYEFESGLTIDSIGKMYCFLYDPKMKKELPYYDKYPLIFPIEMYNDRFLGINLHYLPPSLRARLMDALMDTITNTNIYDKKTRLQINYGILKAATKYRYFKPCIKMYLKSHVRSKFMLISPDLWGYVLTLPFEQFEKKSKYQVWADSIRKI